MSGLTHERSKIDSENETTLKKKNITPAKSNNKVHLSNITSVTVQLNYQALNLIAINTYMYVI